MVQLMGCHQYGGGGIPMVVVHTLLFHPGERLDLCIKQGTELLLAGDSCFLGKSPLHGGLHQPTNL